VASLIAAGHDGRLGTLMPGAEAIHPIKLNDVDPRAWLADVLARIADHPASRLDELLPWNWQRAATEAAAKAA
jgi:IS66 C-terminal element